MLSFIEHLQARINRQQSLLVVALEPTAEVLDLPATLTREEQCDRLGTWLETVIAQTHDHVCAYKPTLGCFTALGAPGIALLEKVLCAIPPEIPVILDAKHGDLNSSSQIAQSSFEHWRVGAVTLTPYAGQDLAAPFLVYADRAVFVVCHTSNPGAFPLQEYPTPESPFYLHLIEEVQRWGAADQVALEIGSQEASVFAQVRHQAPERWILARSIWGEGAHLRSILVAGLDEHGEKLLVPVPTDWLQDLALKERIAALQHQVNQIRQQVRQDREQCDRWLADVCFLEPHPHQDLILQLFDLECLLFGEYVQASGAVFSYYIDLRKIISNPQVFSQVLQAYGDILKTLEFDRLAGIPYGSLPTATGLAMQFHTPMIYPRKEAKAHGTRRAIEGHYQPGEKIVVVDDVLITGSSVVQGIDKLESVGLKVQDVVVFIDHESEGKKYLGDRGYRSHAVLTLSEITETLYGAGRLTPAQYSCLQKSS